MNNIDILKQEIAKHKRIADALVNASDEMLIENESLILNAIDSQTNLIQDGYVIDVWVNEDLIEWCYSPATAEAKAEEKKYSVMSKYLVPLNDTSLYTIDLNDVSWTESKRGLYNVTRELVDSEVKKGKGFWLYGSTNTGKTFYSIALLNKMVNSKEARVAYVDSTFINITADNILQRRSDSTIADAIDILVKADYLIFDSFDMSWFNKWVKENILLPILELRDAKNKVTIFISNIELSKYDEKIKFSSKDYDQELAVNEKITSKIKSLIKNEIKI